MVRQTMCKHANRTRIDAYQGWYRALRRYLLMATGSSSKTVSSQVHVFARPTKIDSVMPIGPESMPSIRAGIVHSIVVFYWQPGPLQKRCRVGSMFLPGQQELTPFLF